MSILYVDGFDTQPTDPRERCEVCDRSLRGSPQAVRAVSVVGHNGVLVHHLVCSQTCQDVFLIVRSL